MFASVMGPAHCDVNERRDITAASCKRLVDPTGFTQKVRDFGFICARILCLFRVEHVGTTSPFRYALSQNHGWLSLFLVLLRSRLGSLSQFRHTDFQLLSENCVSSLEPRFCWNPAR